MTIVNRYVLTAWLALAGGMLISIESNAQQYSLVEAPEATVATNKTSSSFRAHWNVVTGADSYELDVSTNAAFSSVVRHLTNLSGTYADVTGLTDKTRYYYRVRAVNAYFHKFY